MRHDWKGLVAQWGDCLACLAEVVAEGQKSGPDESLAQSLNGHSKRLLELAKRSTAYTKVLQTIEELLSDFGHVLEGHTALAPYLGARTENPQFETSDAGMEMVEDLRCQLRSLTTVQSRIQSSGQVITEAGPERQSKVIEQLQILSRQRNEHIRMASQVLNTLFPEIAKLETTTHAALPTDHPDRSVGVGETDTDFNHRARPWHAGGSGSKVFGSG